jgi:hypothetical protein
MPTSTDTTTEVVGRMLTPLEKLIEAIATGTLHIQIKRTVRSKNVTSTFHPTSDISLLH